MSLALPVHARKTRWTEAEIPRVSGSPPSHPAGPGLTGESTLDEQGHETWQLTLTCDITEL